MASEAAIGQGHVVQLGPRWRTRSGRVDQRWSGAPERACETDAALGRSSGHGPGGSCNVIHGAEFGVGDSYHVVRSDRDIFAA